MLIYIHKEQELDDVERRYPGRALRARRRQAPHPDRREEGLGRARHHGLPAPGALRPRPPTSATYPPADVTIERIGDLVDYDLPALLGASRAREVQRRVSP